MRTRWKLFGGVGALAVGTFLMGHSGTSHGDPAQSSQTTTAVHDPSTLYDLPGKTTYEQLSASDKASVDSVQARIAQSQPDASYSVFSSAAATMATDAQAQIAARAIGLVDTLQDGVVP